MAITPVAGLFNVIIDEARLRSGPSSESDLIDTLPKGEIVISVGVAPSKDWYRVRVLGPEGESVEGWISAEFIAAIDLTPPSADADEPVSKSSATLPSAVLITDTPVVTLEAAAEPILVTGLLNANCRAGPGTVYGVLGFLLKDQEAPLEGRSGGGGWWWIGLPGGSANCWVSDVTVTVSGDTSGLPLIPAPPTPTLPPIPTPTSTPTDTPTATPTDTPTATPTDTPTATPACTPADAPAPPNASIAGAVKDKDGAFSSGVEVEAWVSGLVGTTDQNGCYVINNVPVPENNEVIVTAEGSAGASDFQIVMVKEGQTSIANFTVTESFPVILVPVKGRVLTDSGGAQGAKVWIWGLEECGSGLLSRINIPAPDCVTNEDGLYDNIEGLPGCQLILAEWEGMRGGIELDLLVEREDGEVKKITAPDIVIGEAHSFCS